MQAKLLALLTTAALAWTLPAKSRDAERARYESAVAPLVEVAFDPAEPSIFPGSAGRTRTAALLASIASYESNFRADVLDGRVKGDHGESVCALQIRVPQLLTLAVLADLEGARLVSVELREDGFYVTAIDVEVDVFELGEEK